MKIDKEFTITGIEVRGDKLRPTIYVNGIQKKITIDWILSKKNLLLAFCIRTLIQHYLDSKVICIENIDDEIFNKISQGLYLLNNDTDKTINNVNNTGKKQNEHQPLMSTLLLNKLEEYQLAIDNKSYSKYKITTGTYKKYRTAINYHFIPNFGSHRINELTSLIVIEWIKNLKITIGTFRDYIIPLVAVFNDAKSHKYITHNEDVFADKTIIKYAERVLPENIETSNPLTQEELQKIIDAPDSYMKNHILFSTFSGLRIGEQINLRISDISFKDHFIHVHSQSTSGIRDAAVKSATSVRKVKILKMASSAIINQLSICASHQQNEFLFFNPNTSAQWSTSTKYGEHLKEYLHRLGIAERSSHDMRHTYASILVKTENLYWIANQLGHTDIELLIKTYGHWIPNNKLKGGYELNNAELDIYQPAIDME